jgi:hypothetical protein
MKLKTADRSSAMKICHFVLCVNLLVPCLTVGAAAAVSPYDELIPIQIARTTRSQAMGLSFPSIGEGASALFINPAGLVAVRGLALYGDYTEGTLLYPNGCSRGCLALPFGRFAAAAGFFNKNSGGTGTWNVFLAGAAWRIVEGAKDSFLSIGASAKIARISGEMPSDCDVCGPPGTDDTGVTADIGVIVRPLPMVSIGCSSANLFEKDFETYGLADGRWRRHTRVGVSWLLQDRIIVSWDRSYYGPLKRDHYGISVRTSVPLELMTGFYDEKVTGGMRFTQRMFDLSVAFSPDGEGRLAASFSAEIYFRKKPEEIRQ